MPQPIQRDLGGPYGWCVQLCIVDIGSRARQYDHWVHYVFELGDTGQKEIEKALQTLSEDSHYREFFRIASYSFAPKKGPGAVMQLQAADFIAYESYKRVENVILDSPRRPRISAGDLIRDNIDILGLWRDDLLTEWVQRAMQRPTIQRYVEQALTGKA
jgi:hypothetical protein